MEKPKDSCLRCPNKKTREANRHKDDLHQCLNLYPNKDFPRDRLWPRFRGLKNPLSRTFKNKTEARVFMASVRDGLNSGVAQHWSPATMESAAQLGYLEPEPEPEPGPSESEGQSTFAPSSSATPVKADQAVEPDQDDASKQSILPYRGHAPVVAESTSIKPKQPSGSESLAKLPLPPPMPKISSPVKTTSSADAPKAKSGPNLATSKDMEASDDNDKAQKHETRRVCKPEESHRAQVRRLTKLPDSWNDDESSTTEAQPQPEPLNRLTGFLDTHKLQINQGRHLSSAVDFGSKQPSDIATSKTNLDFHTLRPGFSTQGGLLVRSNHFLVEFPQNIALYEYRVSGFPEKPSRPKRRVLISDMIEMNRDLWNARENFATDHHSKIISTVPLCASDTIQQGDEVVRVSIPSYKPGTREKPDFLPMTLTFVKQHLLNGLREYIAGNNESYQDAGAIEAMNIVIAETLADDDKNIFQTGRNRFYFRPGWTDLQHSATDKTDNVDSAGLVSTRGYVARIKPGMGSLLLTVNRLNSVFYRPQHVSEYLKHFKTFGVFPNDQRADANQTQVIASERLLDKAKRHLKGLRVFVDFERGTANGDSDIDKPGRRVKTLTDIGNFPKKQEITIEGKKTTVWKHLMNKYPDSDYKPGIEYPVINVGRADAENQKFYLANQLLVMPDQQYRYSPLPSAVTSAMISAARRTPEQNIKSIMEEGMKFLSLKDLPPMLKSMGLRISPGMVTVPARVIAGPSVLYKDQSMRSSDNANKNKGYFEAAPDQDAVFKNVDLGFNELHASGSTAKVQFFCPSVFGPNTNFVQSCYNNLQTLLPTHGLQKLKCHKPERIFERIANWDVQSLTKQLRNFSKEIDLAVVIFSRSNVESRNQYANFKIVADQVLGLKSICFNEQSVRGSHKIPDGRGKRSAKDHEIHDTFLTDYMRNIAMKLNLRCGNYNQTIKDLPGLDQDTMIIGADVTHPGGGSIRGAPSIAAVVASDDADFARYPGSMRLNPPRQESIELMEGMVYQRLLHWYNVNGCLPNKVLFYRDGLADSQFAEFRHHEINAVRQAHRNIFQQKFSDIEYGPDDLRITAVVVTKRHDTRLYPPSANAPRSQTTSKGNCLPGTVVDSGITHPYYFDFFLLSHHAPQGTAKPAHYFVLENEMELTPKDLQDLTFKLCHMYGKSANAVSYAPPAYYADRLCERGRLYLQPLYENAKEYRDLKLKEDDVMEKAKAIFYKRGDATDNPWHENHDGKMFWM